MHLFEALSFCVRLDYHISHLLRNFCLQDCQAPSCLYCGDMLMTRAGVKCRDPLQWIRNPVVPSLSFHAQSVVTCRFLHAGVKCRNPLHLWVKDVYRGADFVCDYHPHYLEDVKVYRFVPVNIFSLSGLISNVSFAQQMFPLQHS